MKDVFLVFSFVLLFTFNSFSQDNLMSITATEPNSGVGIGFNINQFQDDFGIGFNVNSPSFASDVLSVRLRGNYMFYEHVQVDSILNTSEIVWTPYTNIMLGLTIISGIVNKHLRLYAEAGGILILPNAEFSTESSVLGGYGVFGFEFFMEKIHSYYLEMGGIGSSAKADKIPNKPIYSTGLMLSVGYRINLK